VNRRVVVVLAEEEGAGEGGEDGGDDGRDRPDAEAEDLPEPELESEEDDAEAQALARRPGHPGPGLLGKHPADGGPEHDRGRERAQRRYQRGELERHGRTGRRDEESRCQGSGLDGLSCCAHGPIVGGVRALR
jgi:hypothetical protein